MQATSRLSHFKNDRFLRSINIVLDADSPENLQHFQPTQKSNKLLSAVLGMEQDRNFMVIAPYGTGKSLSASVALHAVENRPKSRLLLQRILRETTALSYSLRLFLERRVERGDCGLAIPLHGYLRSCPSSLKDGAIKGMKRIEIDSAAEKLSSVKCNTLDDLPTFLRVLAETCQRQRLDRVTIIWDEFGRHLETLISEGRTERLLDLQVLAECCERSLGIPFSFTLLMHQVLARYSHRLPQSVQNEWAKVEGRFNTIQYIDTSKELYLLLVRMIEKSFEGSILRDAVPNLRQFRNAACILRNEGLLSQFSQAELERLLSQAFPVEPVALYLLPRVSARVAQNERTMFTFLYEIARDEIVTPETIYDYFSDLMHADVAVGGTSRAWIEAESAISKCQDRESIRAIKTACLLGLGLSGERSHASLRLLTLALAGSDDNRIYGAEKTVADLIDKNLLLHRKHTNSVSVWHGTDYDLRGRLEELMDRRGVDFDCISFLTEHIAPKVWKAVRYYSEFGVKRYFSASYASPTELIKTSSLLQLREGQIILDGRIIHVLPQSAEDLVVAQERARQLQQFISERIIISVPSEQLNIWRAALEVFCLLELQGDEQLTSQDPMVSAELREMLVDAQSYLTKLLSRATEPKVDGPVWFCSSGELVLNSASELRDLISAILEKRFSLTPFFNNELIVRHRISKPIANARRKLMSGILNQTGHEMFGLPDSEYRTPQASICRTVFKKTGLYREDGDRFRFAFPSEISDGKLRFLWEQLQYFFAEPTELRKSFSTLVGRLSDAPFGIRSGLLPLLICAGYRAFCEEGLLFQEGEYLGPVYPTSFEDICRSPDKFQLRVVKLDVSQKAYLQKVKRIFSSDENLFEIFDRSYLATAYYSLEKWMRSLPAAALFSTCIGDDVKRLQSLLKKGSDPETLFLRELPQQFGEDFERICVRLATFISELTALTTRYQKEVYDHLEQHFAICELNETEDSNGLLSHAQRWAESFPTTIRSKHADLLGRRLLEIAATEYSCQGELLDEIATLLVGRPIIQWDSATPARFRDRIDDVISRLERRLINLPTGEMEDVSEIEGVRNILRSRIRVFEESLRRLNGGELSSSL